jgi:type I restriction enzyme, S subunit
VIALLNEQKQVIIHRAVTRGLDPSVPLKASGISWLGDIPQHWEATKLYRVTDPARKIMYGIVLPGPDVDTGVYIIKGGNCEDGRLRAECLSRTTTEIESGYARSRLRGSDIVYAIRGSIGAAQIVPDELAGANLTQDAARIAPGPGIFPLWLLFAVRSQSFFSKLEAGALGATIRGINIRDLKRADLAVPPMEEQEQIAMFLLERTGRVNTAISRLEREIELLREYRSRLVADVVTGKVDVREAAVQLPQEAAVDTPEDDTDLDDETEGAKEEAAA